MKAKGVGFATVALLALAACSPDHDERTAGQKLDRAIDKTEQAVNKAEKKAGEVADKLEKRVDALGQSAKDTAITAAIKADLLKDPQLSALKIEVETSQGVVTLNGIAPSRQAADRAARIAIAVAGVREVRNHVAPRQG